jgi:DMSO/TMAO reductase YedYZ molybdopterin-dependent catalytic subunit
MTSCAEWTGVLLSTLLKETGVKGSASWFVAEGAQEVKGASSMPIAKAMDDCLLCYGMNGEPVRPQQGFPLRLLAPGFEGIFNTKYLRRIKLVDRYYMNYNDYGHLDRDPNESALGFQIGPKSVITYPSGGECGRILDVRIIKKSGHNRKPYSMTSSASPSRVLGTVIPSVLAVDKLTTNSKLIGRTTGRSAGLVPMRILPA